MVAGHDEGGAGQNAGAISGLHNLGNGRVHGAQRSSDLEPLPAFLVLKMVRRGQMHSQQGRLVGFEQVGGHGPEAGFAGQVAVFAERSFIHLATRFALQLLGQSWGRGQGLHGRQAVLLRVQRPHLGHIVVYGCAHRHGPGDARTFHPGFAHGVPKGRGPDLICIPVPGPGLSAPLKGRVVVDAVPGGQGPGQDGCVGGVSDTRENSAHRLCLRSFPCHVLDQGHGPGLVAVKLWPEPVDRD